MYRNISKRSVLFYLPNGVKRSVAPGEEVDERVIPNVSLSNDFARITPKMQKDEADEIERLKPSVTPLEAEVFVLQTRMSALEEKCMLEIKALKAEIEQLKKPVEEVVEDKKSNKTKREPKT